MNEHELNQVYVDIYVSYMHEKYPDGFLKHDDFLMPFIFTSIFWHLMIGLGVYFLV